MKAKIKLTKFHIAVIFLAVIMISFSLMSNSMAKYVKDVPFDGKVTFTADLAGNFELFEHQAVKNNSTGEYSLGEAEVSANTYILIPGLNVPKDPTVRITAKSTVDAYVYVELLPTTDLDGISYEIDSCWKKLDITGKNVYVYFDTVNNTPFVVDESFGTSGSGTINIIKDKTFTVSDSVKGKTTQTITFHAYMAQKTTETNTLDDSKNTFTTNFTTP